MKTLMFAVSLLCLPATAFAAAPAAAPAPVAAPAKAAEPAKAEEFTSVTTTGEAAIIGGDSGIPAAKEKAKEAALREAVHQVVGTSVSADTMTKDFTLVSDVIFAHTEGYVRKYEIISEKVEESVVTTKIRADVGKGAVDRDVAAVKTIIGMRGQRRVYVAITDVSAETQGKTGTTAVIRHGQFDGILREALRKDGFTCLDPNIVDGKLKSRSAIQSLANAQEAVEIGNLVGADIVIYGNATASQTEGDYGKDNYGKEQKIFKVPMRVAIGIAATDSGESLADVVLTEDSVANASLLSFSDAANKNMKATATKATAAVRSALFEAWRKQLTGAQHIVVQVSGLRDYTSYTAFEDLLKGHVRGVKDVYSGRFEKGSASMEIALAGTVKTLAAELQGKNFKGQIIQVTKATNNTLELALGK